MKRKQNQNYKYREQTDGCQRGGKLGKMSEAERERDRPLVM